MPNVYQSRLVQIRPQYSANPDTNVPPQNVFWFQSSASGTPSLSDLEAIGNQFDSSFQDVYTAYGGTDKEYKGCVVTDWSTATGLEWPTFPGYAGVPGTQGVSNPAQVALLLSYQIQLRWRGGHFRSYLPYVGESALSSTDKNRLSDTTASIVATKFNGMISFMAASNVLGGQTFVVYKHKNGVGGPATPYQISTFTVNTLLATQRRRIRRVTRK